MSSKKQQTKPKNKQQQKKKGKNTAIQALPPPKAAPVAKTKTYVSSVPKVMSFSLAGTRWRHREFVDPIIVPANATGFTRLFTLPLNPGIDDTFSWLSNNAINWERYVFHSLAFVFITRSPTTLSGSIMMAVDYDAADAAPIDEITLMSYEGAKEDAVWKDIRLPCSKRSLLGGRSEHFVRTGPLANNLDIKTYDGGNLYIYTDVSGLSTPLSLGKLFVEYDVEFMTPQLPPTGDPLVGTSGVQSGGTLSNTAPLGNAPANSVQNSIGQFVYDAATFRNQFIPTETIANGILNWQTTGVGLTGIQQAVVQSGPGVVTPSQAVINSAGSVAMASYFLQGLTKGTVLSMPYFSSLTSAGPASASCSRSSF